MPSGAGAGPFSWNPALGLGQESVHHDVSWVLGSALETRDLPTVHPPAPQTERYCGAGWERDGVNFPPRLA